jgi:Tol biopolymer transport system component
VLFLNGISANDVAFSHDGKWIVYVTYPDRTLWKSRTDGSQRLQLTAPPMRAFVPAWSPDDQHIVLEGAAREGSHWKIYLISPNGGTPEMLIPDQDSQEAGATWSPDGKSIVYGFDRISGSSSAPAVTPAVDIRIVDLKTRRSSVVPGSQGLYGPQWSPDGRFVAALLGVKDHLTLYDTTTQKWSTLLAEGVGYPSWSRDSQSIYCNTFWRKDPALVRVAVANGRVDSFPVNFATAGSFGAWSGATPDGSFLLLRDLSSKDIYSLDLELP